MRKYESGVKDEALLCFGEDVLPAAALTAKLCDYIDEAVECAVRHTEVLLHRE